MNQPQDFLARQAALDATKSFAVSAPAGSGKTGLLTQRVLKLLSISQYPEEVLAITFTRKAAGEMQDRILKALWNAKENPEPENPHDKNTWQLAQAVLKRDNEKQWNLVECPQRLRVQTIDSLCSSISKQLPLANGFGSTPAPTDNADNAYKAAIARLFTLLDSNDPLRDDITRLLTHLDNNLAQLESLLMILLAKRDQWLSAIYRASTLNAREYLESILSEVTLEHLQKVNKALKDQASDLVAVMDWAGTNLAATDSTNPYAAYSGIVSLPKVDVKNLSEWQLLSGFLLTGGGTFRKTLNVKMGFPAAKDNKESTTYKNKFGSIVGYLQETQPGIEELLASIHCLPTPYYPESQWALLESLTRLLPRLAAELHLVFADSGEADFTAISQSALLALGDDEAPTDAALQLDYRIQHILVDEFQDTSSTQLELLEKLTAGWQPNDGRTLFIVGDGMQSCYAFRSANVGIFLEARQAGIGNLPLIPLDLTVNFRSQSGVVNWVNEKFSSAFPQENDIGRGAVVYTKSIAFKPELAGAPVKFFVSPYANNKADDKTSTEESSESQSLYFAEENENQAIAELIQHLRSEHPNESVALLARSRSHLQSLFPALSRLGLKWQATDIDSLTSRMAIMDLHSLTRALLNPTDRIAWLSILRAPWCGLSLNDLHLIATCDLGESSPRLAENGFPILWQQLRNYTKMSGLSENARQSLQVIVPILQVALAEKQRKRLRTWIEGIWLMLGGPSSLLDKNDIHDIPKFFDLLDQFEQGGTIRDWNEFNQSLSRLYASPRQDADSGLQVMTMHKSKGLEFDHVIMPRLHKRPPNQDQELILWRERIATHGARQLLISPLAPTGGEQDPIYRYMKKEATLQLDYEATRLFYVGCTRAIKHLYLFASLEKEVNEDTPDAISFKAPSSRSLLNSIWKNVSADVQVISVNTSSKHSNTNLDANAPLTHLVRLKSLPNSALFSEESLLSQYRGRDYDNEDDLPTPESTPARLARHTGTLIHLVLQEFSTLKTKPDIDVWFSQRSPFWELTLNAWGFDSEEKQAALIKALNALRQAWANKQGQWILQFRASAANELPIMHKQGGGNYQTLKTNIVDRTFIENGVRWVIDYKSSEPVPNQSRDEFIQQEITKYTEQLRRYQRCFNDMGAEPVRVALFFPLLAHDPLVEVNL